jgi:hypothetical protein
LLDLACFPLLHKREGNKKSEFSLFWGLNS